MGDVTASAALAKKRLTVEISQMELNIERMELRKMELVVEQETIEKNIEASNKRIIECQEQLKITGAN